MSVHMSDIMSNLPQIIVTIDETKPYFPSDNNNVKTMKAGKFQCDVCGQTLTAKRSYDAHISEVHLKSQPFCCKICTVSC